MNSVSAADPDRSVVIVASDGSHLPSGMGLTGPVTSMDKLESLIVWARDKRGCLQGESARVWVVGAAVRQLTGQSRIGEDVDEQLGRALAGLVSRGWELSGADGRLVVARGSGPGRISVDVVAEPQPWLAGGDDVVSEDAGELGRRLRRWTAAVGVLPQRTAVGSAAVVFDAIQAAKNTRRAAVVAAAGLPAGVELTTAVQPTWVMDTTLVDRALERAHELVLLEQFHPKLASAGMLSLGWVPARTVGGAEGGGGGPCRQAAVRCVVGLFAGRRGDGDSGGASSSASADALGSAGTGVAEQ